MKPPPLLRIFLFIAVFAVISIVPVIASSCNNICPKIGMPFPTGCLQRTTYDEPIQKDVCTCIWDPCSCGYSCHFPQCSTFNTTVKCIGEPCTIKNCEYGCTNDYCNGCDGICLPINTNDISTCYYNGKTFTQGQSTKSTDGCNTCTCSNGDMACTLMACSATGNNTCYYNGKTYKPGQSTKSIDGCNTCFCDNNGNMGCTLMGCFNNYNTATYVGVTPTVLFATSVALAMIV